MGCVTGPVLPVQQASWSAWFEFLVVESSSALAMGLSTPEVSRLFSWFAVELRWLDWVNKRDTYLHKSMYWAIPKTASNSQAPIGGRGV